MNHGLCHRILAGISRTLLCLPIGAIGGWLCGSIILSTGALIGKSGDTGCEYIGYWSPAYIVLALFYGAPIGGLALSAVYLLMFADFTLKSLAPRAWQAALATTMGGMLGTLCGLLPAALLGVFSFLLGCVLIRARMDDQ